MNSQIWDKAISFKQQLVTAVLWFTPLTINVVAFKAPHFLANLPGWGEEQQAPRLKIMAVARQLYIYIYVCVCIYLYIYIYLFIYYLFIFVCIYIYTVVVPPTGRQRSVRGMNLYPGGGTISLCPRAPGINKVYTIHLCPFWAISLFVFRCTVTYVDILYI